MKEISLNPYLQKQRMKSYLKFIFQEWIGYVNREEHRSDSDNSRDDDPAYLTDEDCVALDGGSGRSSPMLPRWPIN